MNTISGELRHVGFGKQTESYRTKVTGQKVTKLLGQKITRQKVTIYMFYPGGQKVTIYIFYPGGQKVTGQIVTKNISCDYL